MEQKDFYTARNLKNLEKIEYLKDELPSFVDEYFLGIENQTSTLTRLNYAYDLRIFFDYLAKKRFKGKTVQEFVLSDLEKVSATDIERLSQTMSTLQSPSMKYPPGTYLLKNAI